MYSAVLVDQWLAQEELQVDRPTSNLARCMRLLPIDSAKRIHRSTRLRTAQPSKRPQTSTTWKATKKLSSKKSKGCVSNNNRSNQTKKKPSNCSLSKATKRTSKEVKKSNRGSSCKPSNMSFRKHIELRTLRRWVNCSKYAADAIIH